MKQKFFKNLFFFLTINLVVKPIYVFGIDRVVQNNVGAEVYGSYFPLLNLVIIFQIFLDLGIENYTRKELGGYPGKINKLLPNIIIVKAILSTLFIGVFSVAGYFLLQNSFDRKLLVILLINQSMASFILYLRANMGGLQLFKSETLVSVLDRFFMILICGSLLIIPFTRDTFKMEWFVLAQSVSYGITLIVSGVIVIKKSGLSKLRFSFQEYLPILRRLWPFTLLSLLMAFYFRIDSIFLRFLLDDGAVQAGIYAQGFRIVDFMSNYALIFSFILLPTFAKMIARKEQIASLLKLSSLALIVPSFALLSGVFFYRTEVFNLLYKEHVELSADVFGVMILSFFSLCITYTFGALLTAKGCLKQLNIMASIAVVISIILNVILIPKFNVFGAAISNASAQVFTILFHVIVVKTKFELRFNALLFTKILLFIVVSVSFSWFISGSELPWHIGILIVVSFSIVFSFIIKLLHLSYITELLRTPGTSE